MGKETVEVMVAGGKATAAPPLGPALGPLKVNIGAVVAAINEKTKDFAGMQVPVTVIVDTETKAFTITVGTPPASQLIIKEAGITKGAGNPLQDKVADLKIEQIIKIAKMKSDNLLGKSLKEKAKEIVGTCNSMGVMVEGKSGKDAIADINAGKFDQKILSGKTELSKDELKAQEEEKKHLVAEMEARREEFLARAKTIKSQMEGKTANQIRNKMQEEGIPMKIMDEIAPAEKKAA